MPSTPTHKNLSALIELPNSRLVRNDGVRTETRLYSATYDVCLAALKSKGVAGSGDLTGYIIKESAVARSRGEQGLLTDVWTVGGPDADPETIPLPEDTCSLQSQDLNPSTEKSDAFVTAVLDQSRYDRYGATGSTKEHKTLVQWAREAGLSVDSDQSNDAWNALLNMFVLNGSNDQNFAEAVLLGELLRRGVGNFYKSSFVYTWTTYHFSKPSISVGGFIEVPGGPLESEIAALGLVCLRQADDLNFDGQFWQLTNRWICAQDDNETFWDRFFTRNKPTITNP